MLPTSELKLECLACIIRCRLNQFNFMTAFFVQPLWKFQHCLWIFSSFSMQVSTTQLFQVWLLDITNFYSIFLWSATSFSSGIKWKKKLLKSFCFLKKFYSRIYSSFLWAYTTYMKLFWQKVFKKVWRGWFFILFTMWLDFVYDKVHICFGPRRHLHDKFCFSFEWAYFEIHDIFSRNFNKNENLSWKI